MTSFYLSTAYQPPKPPKDLPLDAPWALLGNISPQDFMKTYWHKKPLLVRGAIPAFALAKEAGTPLSSPISAKELIAIAGKPETESRLIQSKPWRFSQGPFPRKSIPALNSPCWTLLLQGMEARHPAAATILSWFRFIPDARLDDLMISIASTGGGVGPHFDSYDVFLIQMEGRRQWRISTQDDLSLNPRLPLKILQHFVAEDDWVLEPGDMLYLPPHVAHDGIALDSGCQTWSVGFRAPSYRELLREGLWRLAESLDDIPELAQHFADPKQEACSNPEQLPAELIKQLGNALVKLKLDQVATFLPGVTAYLSEPKAQAIFDAPLKPLAPHELLREMGRHHLKPHPQTRLLSIGPLVYCNGEEMTAGQPNPTQEAWRQLSADKALNLTPAMRSALKITEENSLFDAYMAGWLILED